MTLEDGTQLILDGATAVSWHMDARRREIKLISGEAYFSVAPDRSRPLFVEAGSARIRVTGTRFDVRLGKEATMLTLEEGSVVASREGDFTQVTLRPNEQIEWRAGTDLHPMPARVQEAMAWKQRRLVFNSRPLSEVVEGLSRHLSGRTFLFGSARSELVTIVFDVSDPEAVLASIEQNLGVKVVRIMPLLTVIY